MAQWKTPVPIGQSMNLEKKTGIWSYIEMLFQSVHLKAVWIKTAET